MEVRTEGIYFISPKRGISFGGVSELTESLRLPYVTSALEMQKELEIRTGDRGKVAKEKACRWLYDRWGVNIFRGWCIDSGGIAIGNETLKDFLSAYYRGSNIRGMVTIPQYVLDKFKPNVGIDTQMEFKGLWLPRQIARFDGEALTSLAIAKSMELRAGILELTLDAYADTGYKSSFISQYQVDEAGGKISTVESPRPERGFCLADIKKPVTTLSYDGNNTELRTRLCGLQSYYLSEMFVPLPLRDLQLPTYLPSKLYIDDLTPCYCAALVQNLMSGKEPIPSIMVRDGIRSTKNESGRITFTNLRINANVLLTLRWTGECYSSPYGNIKLTKDEVIQLACTFDARPSAEWNYQNLYLFLPGILFPEMGFLVTPFEFDDEKILGATKRAIEFARAEFGLAPLLVPFLPMSWLKNSSLLKATSKVGKYPEYAQYKLSDQTIGSLIGLGAESSIERSVKLGLALAEIVSRDEIKVRKR